MVRPRHCFGFGALAEGANTSPPRRRRALTDHGRRNSEIVAILLAPKIRGALDMNEQAGIPQVERTLVKMMSQ